MGTWSSVRVSMAQWPSVNELPFYLKAKKKSCKSSQMNTQKVAALKMWELSTTLLTNTHKKMYPYFKKVQQKVTRDVWVFFQQHHDKAKLFVHLSKP